MATSVRFLRRLGAVAALMVALAMPPEAALAQAQPTPAATARTAALIPLNVPLLVDGRRVTELDVVLDPLTGALGIEGAPLLTELAPLLTVTRATLLRASIDTRGMISLDDLRLVGVVAAFDEAELRLL